jgi:hypothetical protein
MRCRLFCCNVRPSSQLHLLRCAPDHAREKTHARRAVCCMQLATPIPSQTQTEWPSTVSLGSDDARVWHVASPPAALRFAVLLGLFLLGACHESWPLAFCKVH